MPAKYRGPVFMALAASIWGGMYVVSKLVLVLVTPLALVWLRYVVGLAALGILGVATRQRWRLRWRDIPLIILIGISGYGISIWAQFRGTQLSTAQAASVITAATPAFMVVFGRLLLGERVTWRRAAAVAAATAGVLVIVGVGQVSTRQGGGFILLLAAVTWALMSVLVKRVPGDYSALVVTTYGILVAAVLITPLALPQVPPLAVMTRHPLIWGGLLYLGVVSTAGAFFLWTRGVQLVDAGRGGVYFFFQPLVGTLLGWLILGEPVGWGFVGGALLIVLGVALTL
ncbi:MAG: DMT family transporter [Thermaerobacter sp.]|nr:DMT family transporter [Thermaerobacter sp.]